MKLVVNILLTAIIAILGWQFLNLYQQYRGLTKTSEQITAETAALSKENEHLNSDLNYFSNTDNLEKELKSKTNYKDSGEKMIVIVPPKTTQTNQ